MKYIISSFIILMTVSFSAESNAAMGASTKLRQPQKHKEPQKAMDQTAAAIEELANVDNLSNWMTYYYMKPSPEKLVPALLLADKLGLLQGDSAPPLQAFASRVLAQNPDKVKEWFAKMGPMSDSGKTMVLTSIWWSNTKEGKELLNTIASTLPEKSKIEFHKQIDSSPPELENMEIASPDVLDMLWACFSATGDTKYVKRLMSTLAWRRNDSKDLPKMLIASAASWSLVSNINQHAKVKEFCQSLEMQDADLKPYLEKALAEAAQAAAVKKNKQEAAAGLEPTATEQKK